MKEATGELNMTVVTVVAIAALVGIFYMFIWPIIQASMALSSACSAAGDGVYNMTLDNGGTVDCNGGNCKISGASGLGVNNMQKTCN